MKKWLTVGLLLLTLLLLSLVSVTAAQAEHHWRYVERAAAIGHWVFDPETEQFTYSEGALRLLGIEDSTHHKEAMLDMVLPEYREQMRQSLQRLVQDHRPHNVSLRFRKPWGRIIDVHSQGIYDEVSQTFVGVVQDVTPAQEALRLLIFRTQFFNTLSTVAVLVLTAAVALLAWFYMRKRQTEQLLLLREQELREKNQEMERFVQTISHDLRGPLVTVQSFLGLLQQDIDNGDTDLAKKDMDYIRGGADKMDQLLGALLQLSQIGRMENDPATRSANDLVQECLTTLAGAIRAKNIEVVTKDMPQLLRGDLLRLGQIWQNLVENAVKYMGDQPQPRIELGVERQRRELVFYVHDNGAGIATEHQERIFGLFAQLNSRNEGSGLGLALVSKIVESYQGRIWVASQGVGQGSCFYFTLPAADPKSRENITA